MKELKEGQVWKYIGPGEGRGEKHKIIEVQRNGPSHVITAGEILSTRSNRGHSWLGTPTLFARQFQPINGW